MALTNYPSDVRLIVGSRALKQSLRTSDPKLARRRIAELDKRYDEIVATARATGVVVRDLLTVPYKDLCIVEDSPVSSALLLSDGAVSGWDHGPFPA